MLDKEKMTNDETIVNDVIDTFRTMMHIAIQGHDDYINAFVTLSKDSDIEKLKELIGSQLKIKINTILLAFKICDVIHDSSDPFIILNICLPEDSSLSDASTKLNKFDKITYFNTDLIDNSNIIDMTFNFFVKGIHQTIKIAGINNGEYNFEKNKKYTDDRIEMGREFFPIMELLKTLPELYEIAHKNGGEPKSSVPIMENTKDKYFDKLFSNTPFDEDPNGYHPKCIHRLSTLKENGDGTYTCTQCGAILKFIED